MFLAKIFVSITFLCLFISCCFRGEIEELFENVTREELARSIHMGDHRREKHMRALMLVLPYHANDVTPEKIQQLYTKKPMTRLMSNNGLITAQSTNMPAFRPLATKSTTTTEASITVVPSMQRYPPMPAEPFGLRDSVIPEKGIPGPFSIPTNPPPSPFPIKLHKLKKKAPSQLTIAQRGKVDVASISITQAPLYTTTTKKPTRNPQSVFEILQAIGLHQERVKASNMKTSTTTTTSTTTMEPPSTTTEMSEDLKRLLLEFGIYQQGQAQLVQDQPFADVPYVPDVQFEPPYSFSVQNPGVAIGIDDFRPLPVSYEGPVYPGYTILETENESQASGSQKVQVSVKAPESVIETTPGTTTTTSSTTTTTVKPKITKPKVNKPTDFQNFRPIPNDNPKSISEDFQNILRSFGLLGGNPGPTKSRVPKKHKTRTTSTKTSTITETPMKAMPDIINIPLPSDMMAVLENLGVSTKSPIAIKIQMPSSSKAPTRNPTSTEPRSTRVSKRTTLAEVSTTQSTTDVDPDSNAEVIRTTSAQASAFSRRSEIKTTSISTTSTTKKHSSMRPIVVGEIPMEKPRKIDSYPKTNIFKPTTSAKQTSKDDYKKLEHLLETIKELDKLNTTLTSKHLEKLDLNNFNFSDSLLSQGPDPLNFYHNALHPLKNEIKRQEPSDEKDNPTKISLDLNESDQPKITVINAVKASEDLVDEVTTFSPLNQINEEKEGTEDDSDTITTTEEGRSASADELSDSFPNDTDPDEPLDESLPLPRRNGFYFLADWNSFLEVGQDEEKVIVRFDPKIGDPSRFIPVHIPSKTR